MERGVDSAIEDAFSAALFARTRPPLPGRRSRKAAGISYEDYVGCLLECAHWDVTLHGARHGRRDGGIDIVATHGRRRYAFQCKGWASAAVIEDWQILKFKRDVERFQGSTNSWRLVFVTSAQFSDLAVVMGRQTGIILKHLPRCNDWPAIKCNVCQKTGARRYYLPGDPGYRSVKISLEQGDCYVSTEEEAEGYGFQRIRSAI